MNLEQIQEHIHTHRPQAAYLGQREFNLMMREAGRVCTIEIQPTPDCQMTYAGCTIYEVFHPSHVGFSQPDE